MSAADRKQLLIRAQSEARNAAAKDVAFSRLSKDFDAIQAFEEPHGYTATPYYDAPGNNDGQNVVQDCAMAGQPP